MNLFALNLHLFEGEGAAAAAGESAGAEQANPGTTRRGKSGALSNVLYGSQADEVQDAQAAAGEETPEVKVTSNTLEERRKTFRDLINGEYKDVYGEEIQRLINRRFAETQNLQKQVDDAKPILDKLAARYNVLDGDMSKLSQAIDNDHSYWSAAAEEAGMSEDAFREFQLMRQQNAMLMRQQQDQMARAQANQQMQQWFQEAEAVKQQFPGFDLNTELQNPEFVSLLRHHTPMDHAYKVLHFDDIMNNAVQNTVQSTQKAVTENIRAKGARPAENGTASQSAFTVKRSAGALTKADRAEIARRVHSGANIGF